MTTQETTRVLVFENDKATPEWVDLPKAKFIKNLKQRLGAECLEVHLVTESLVLYYDPEAQSACNQCLLQKLNLEFNGHAALLACDINAPGYTESYVDLTEADLELFEQAAADEKRCREGAVPAGDLYEIVAI